MPLVRLILIGKVTAIKPARNNLLPEIPRAARLRHRFL